MGRLARRTPEPPGLHATAELDRDGSSGANFNVFERHATGAQGQHANGDVLRR